MQSTDDAALSTRQAEVAQMVVSGKSTREIALALTLSPRTVETHIGAIYNKYGAPMMSSPNSLSDSSSWR